MYLVVSKQDLKGDRNRNAGGILSRWSSNLIWVKKGFWRREALPAGTIVSQSQSHRGRLIASCNQGLNAGTKCWWYSSPRVDAVDAKTFAATRSVNPRVDPGFDEHSIHLLR